MQRQILRTLARLRFATVEHLRYWCGMQAASTITRSLAVLGDRGLVVAVPGLHPRAYQLTSVGARVIGAPQSGARRRWSPSVISNLCHRNSAEIALRAELAEARGLRREEVYRLGLVPSHAEHGFVWRDRVLLVLVDDYLMRPARIATSWLRLHQRPRPGYYSVLRDGLKAWSTVAGALYVFTTDPEQREQHERFVAERCDFAADVRLVRPLWSTVC